MQLLSLLSELFSVVLDSLKSSDNPVCLLVMWKAAHVSKWSCNRHIRHSSNCRGQAINNSARKVKKKMLKTLTKKLRRHSLNEIHPFHLKVSWTINAALLTPFKGAAWSCLYTDELHRALLLSCDLFIRRPVDCAFPVLWACNLAWAGLHWVH